VVSFPALTEGAGLTGIAMVFVDAMGKVQDSLLINMQLTVSISVNEPSVNVLLFVPWSDPFICH